MTATDRGSIATAGFLPGTGLAAILTNGVWTASLRRPTTPPHRKPFGTVPRESQHRCAGTVPSTTAVSLLPIFKAVNLDADMEG